MAGAKAISEAQKAIIHIFWESCKTQNELAVKVERSQSAISKITIQISLKQSNYDSKPKITAKNEHQLNRILISNQFANCGETSKAWNDAGEAISQSITLLRLDQLIYDSRIPISKSQLTFKQK